MRILAPIVAVFLFAAVGNGQTPARDSVESTGVPTTPAHEPDAAGSSFLADCTPPAPTCTPQWWARGEYVFWAIGTGKLVEIGYNAINSNTFNAFLTATGKDYMDLAERLLGDDRTGYRFGLGGWLDDHQTIGVEADFLRVSRAPLTFNLGRNVDFNPVEQLIPNGDIVLQRAGFRPEQAGAADPRLPAILHAHRDNPVMHTLFLLSHVGLPGIGEDGRQVVIPFGARDLANGTAVFELADQTFWALDLLGRERFIQSDGLTVDGLVGYRRVYYSDALAVHSRATALARPLIVGTTVSTLDIIQTDNTYDGVLVGADVGWRSGCWDLSVRLTATPAYYQANVNRAAGTTGRFPGTPDVTTTGGTYLRSSDLGEFSAYGWTVISEVGLRATRTFGEHFALTFGTSLVYIPDAARALPQLPLGIDPDRALPGRSGTPSVRPLPPELRAIFLSTLTAGLEFRF